MKKEGGGTSYTTPLLFLAWMLISIVLFFIAHKIYWNWKKNQGKKETEKLMREMKEWCMKKHNEHIKKKVAYDEHCEICEGLW